MVASTLLSVLLCAASALALPRAHHHTASPSAASTAFNSSDWAAAQYTYPAGQIQAVSTTFVVPKASVPPGGNGGTTYTALIGVAIDGVAGCGGTVAFEAGVQLAVQGNSAAYYAWYEWLPAASKAVNVNIKAGDSVTVQLSVSSATQGAVSIINNTSGQRALTPVSSASPLCQADVAWKVEQLAPGTLAAFGAVKLTNTVATLAGGGTIGSGNARVANLVDGTSQYLVRTALNADGTVTFGHI